MGENTKERNSHNETQKERTTKQKNTDSTQGKQEQSAE